MLSSREDRSCRMTRAQRRPPSVLSHSHHECFRPLLYQELEDTTQKGWNGGGLHSGRECCQRQSMPGAVSSDDSFHNVIWTDSGGLRQVFSLSRDAIEGQQGDHEK